MVTQLTIVCVHALVRLCVCVCVFALALALASRVWMHHWHLERLRIWKGHLACESGLWVKDVHPAALTHSLGTASPLVPQREKIDRDIDRETEKMRET